MPIAVIELRSSSSVRAKIHDKFVPFQVYGDQEMHDAARRLAMDYILQNADYFSQYITEDIET